MRFGFFSEYIVSFRCLSLFSVAIKHVYPSPQKHIYTSSHLSNIKIYSQLQIFEQAAAHIREFKIRYLKGRNEISYRDVMWCDVMCWCCTTTEKCLVHSLSVKSFGVEILYYINECRNLCVWMCVSLCIFECFPCMCVCLCISSPSFCMLCEKSVLRELLKSYASLDLYINTVQTFGGLVCFKCFNVFQFCTTDCFSNSLFSALILFQSLYSSFISFTLIWPISWLSFRFN